MAESQFPLKKAVIVFGVVAIVAIVAAILTADYIGPMTLLIIALVAGLGGFFLYGWIAGETKKLHKQSSERPNRDRLHKD